jgi:hypothetical protein
MGGVDHTAISCNTFLRYVYYCLPCMEAPGQGGCGMNWQGWIFMIAAWTFIGGLFFFAFKRILFSKKSSNNNPSEEQKKKV